ncbi:unnamed protein product [Paramecium primaurelia]|uniref:Uncharacterized protein n=1 Tax=Paramecium primaurelia TaxID=5886 RepID=A0A8S1MY73_PARPR|nr:unnamed protein product [Paramecium primaurelia]
MIPILSNSDIKYYDSIITLKKDQISHAIAINTENSYLLISCSSYIEIYRIYEKQLRLIQQINCHKRRVSSLCFFKSNRFFISGSFDSYIILWSTALINRSKYLQKLIGHTQSISCILTRPIIEDLIISCSADFSIKFWSQQIENNQQWVCFQTIREHRNIVWGISINQQGSQVISCGEDKQILVIEQNQKPSSNWFVKQLIQVNQSGFRLCYINNNIFVFQPESSANLNIYTQNKNQEYVLTKNIQVLGEAQFCYPYFHSIYNYEKQILINKNGYFLNIIKFNNNIKESQKFTQYHNDDLDIYAQTVQVINFEDNYIFGTLSNDGQYLITWNKLSKELQVSKYQENF